MTLDVPAPWLNYTIETFILSSVFKEKYNKKNILAEKGSKMPKNTVVVNLFAGPGTGKSSLASRLYSDLNISRPFGEVALVQEFAKILVYLNRTEDLKSQPLVTKGQISMLEPFIGNVDIVITDSPIHLGLIYNTQKADEPEVRALIEGCAAKYKSVNFFIDRIEGIGYQSEGRLQTHEEAEEKDREILEMLEREDIPHIRIKNEYDIAAVICHMTELIGMKRELLLNISSRHEEDPVLLSKLQ